MDLLRFWPPRGTLVFWNVHRILFMDFPRRSLDRQSIASVTQLLNLKQKMALCEQGKSCLLPRQCTMSQIDENLGKNRRIRLRIASELTIVSYRGVLLIPRLQKIAHKKRFETNEESIAYVDE